MLDPMDVLDGLRELRDCLARHRETGCELTPVAVECFHGVINDSIERMEIEAKERAFDELVRAGVAEMDRKTPQKKAREIRVQVVRGPQESQPGHANVYPFMRRQKSSGGFNPGGDAA